MNRRQITTGTLTAIALSIVLCGLRQALGDEQPAKPAAHRVAACYFHRTQRCPTCKTITAYLEEALQSRFAEEIEGRQVTLYMIDFQDAKNQRYVKAYQIQKPTFVLLDVHDEKVARWKKLDKVWTLVYKKKEFFRYVEAETRGYLEEP